MNIDVVKTLDSYLSKDSLKLIQSILSPDRLTVLVKEIFYLGDYDFTIPSEAPTIIDAGANVGLASIFFLSKYPKARILAFEPDPDLYRVCSQLHRNNHNVTVINSALDNQYCFKQFSFPEKDQLGGTLTDRKSHETCILKKVRCETLSSYLEKFNHVDFLKLDIEGSELAVLTESKKLLKKVRYLFVEIHQGKGIPRSSLEQIITILRDSGFSIFVLPNHSSRFGSNKFDFRLVNKMSYCLWGSYEGFAASGEERDGPSSPTPPTQDGPGGRVDASDQESPGSAPDREKDAGKKDTESRVERVTNELFKIAGPNSVFSKEVIKDMVADVVEDSSNRIEQNRKIGR